MARKSRLLASLNNTPHLITHEHFNRVLQVLENRALNGKSVKMDGEDDDEEDDKEDCPFDDVGVPVLRVDGPLTYKETAWQAMCGGTSYLGLERSMKQYAKDGHKAVIMHVSSGGGEAYGMKECADNIKAIATKNGMKIYGYAEGIAASAAYGLLCVSDVVVANPSSSDIGNVGCVVRMIDTSEKDKLEGEKKVYVYAGTGKIPYKEDGSFSESYLQDIQHKVDSMYSMFTEHVSSYRSISKETLVNDIQAKSYIAQDAVANRLVDMTMTVEEFKDYIQKVSGQLVSRDQLNVNQTQSGGYMTTEKAAVVEAAIEPVNGVQGGATASLEDFATIQATAAALNLKLETLQAQYEASQTRLAQLENEAVKIKSEKRRSELMAALNNDAVKVEEMMAVTEPLGDEAFSKIVGTFKASSFTTKFSQEVGHGGGVESNPKVQTFEEMMLAARTNK